eukprot:gene10831-14540_t
MSSINKQGSNLFDSEYPGTAIERMINVRERILSLRVAQLNDSWEEVRRSLLWAGGLRDLENVSPGYGYTGHSFNDFNHCDLTTMLESIADNENNGLVKGIQYSNRLGPGIKIASMEELGPGGSWSTCIIGCNEDPPQDVAHIQFRSRIAFKLVWVPLNYSQFVLVDDDGKLLASGFPTGNLPPLTERAKNYRAVAGGKYAIEADKILNSISK